MLHFFLFRNFYGISVTFLITGWATSVGFVCFATELILGLLAYRFGQSNYSLKLKGFVWLSFLATGIYRLYDYLTVGLESDADIFKLFCVYLHFFIPILILIGILIHRKRNL